MTTSFALSRRSNALQIAMAPDGPSVSVEAGLNLRPLPLQTRKTCQNRLAWHEILCAYFVQGSPCGIA